MDREGGRNKDYSGERKGRIKKRRKTRVKNEKKEDCLEKTGKEAMKRKETYMRGRKKHIRGEERRNKDHMGNRWGNEKNKLRKRKSDRK